MIQVTPAEIHVLIVDDDSNILSGTARLLKKAGYTVTQATSGEDALQAIAVRRPDLLLLDHNLPGMDGLEVCHRLKRDPALADVLVVMVSAIRAASDAQAEGLELGADGYISRPIANRELLARVDAFARSVNLTRALRRQTEELKQSEALLREAQRIAGLGSYVFDLANGTWTSSEVLEGLLGIDGAYDRSMAGWLALIHPEDRAMMADYLTNEVIGRDQAFDKEYRIIRRADQAERWLWSRASLARDSQGRPLTLRGTSLDITERKQTEAALLLNTAALTAAANAVVITDRQGTIEWANPAFSALSGWSVAEAKGKNPRDLVKSGQHDTAFYRQMWESLLVGKVWRGEIVNRRRDGALRTEEMTITPLRDERGEIAHFIAIKQDITDQKAMEAHFLQAQRMEAIGTLAGGIAHDLNNILAPILLVAGLVKNRMTDEADRELLAMTQSSAHRGAEIIKQLLTFSRGQEGERAPVQPRHLIKEMERVMRETFPREIDIRVQLPAALWTVVADPTQLHQLLLNLCVNARDAMPDGGHLTIRAANVTLEAGDSPQHPGAKAGPYVLIEVSDTGHGIPAEIRQRIFDPFFTTKPIGKGTGLGLSTVLGIVRSHGGFVTVDSTPNKGSTFKVCLPGGPDGIETMAEVPATPAVLAAGRPTILVVDDERDVRDATRFLLERQDYRVLTANHGQDALLQFLEHRADIRLVLTDLMMPVMNGLVLVRSLRVIDPGLKIIVTSGLTEIAQGRELAALGVSEILPKPCEGVTLLAAVHRRLSED